MSNHNTPWIDPTPPNDDRDRADGVFGMAKDMLGFVPAGLKLYGISPPLLEAFAGNVHYFMNGTRLSQELTTMIRYLVSETGGCKFCVDMNESFLTGMGKTLEELRHAKSNPGSAPLPDKEKALLKLALQAVDQPGSIQESDIEVARSNGWTDRDIFDAVVQAASNRAFNHVLKAFNVEDQTAFA